MLTAEQLEHMLGVAYRNLGLREPAERHFSRAADLRRREPAAETADARSPATPARERSKSALPARV